MRTLLTSIKKIKLKYFGCWLKDQLSRPDWFRNLFANRSTWGVFSIYSHIRRSDGRSKIAYPTREKARKAAEDMGKKYKAHFVAYKCLFCEGWHVSKVTNETTIMTEQPKVVSLEKYTATNTTGSSELNTEKILSTHIPDLAPVYGGFRGRTLSSARQHYAWRPLVDAGIRQVIDLRADYTSGAYKTRCDEFGIRYFHYPVVRGGKFECQMVELFPELCSIIDKGGFYIACAHGLHRTDIALCLYWVFYAADKGIAPPPICGYREDKGLDTHKIMRALNAMYNYMEKRDGKSPIPIDVFRERKEIIKELSKINGDGSKRSMWRLTK